MIGEPQTLAAWDHERAVTQHGGDWLPTKQAKWAMPDVWFRDLGLLGLEDRHVALNRVANRRGI